MTVWSKISGKTTAPKLNGANVHITQATLVRQNPMDRPFREPRDRYSCVGPMIKSTLMSAPVSMKLPAPRNSINIQTSANMASCRKKVYVKIDEVVGCFPNSGENVAMRSFGLWMVYHMQNISETHILRVRMRLRQRTSGNHSGALLRRRDKRMLIRGPRRRFTYRRA